MFGRKKYGQWTLKDVGKHWDKTEHYDDINKETYSYFQRFVDGLRYSNFKSIKTCSKILDICSRTGNGSLYFSKYCKDCTFVCMDVTKIMAEICHKVLSENNVKHNTKMFTKYKLPARDNEFDYILCFETVEHIPKPDIFIKELYRKLKPGGEMILTTPNYLWEFVHWFAAITHIHHSEGPHRFLKRKELIRDIKLAGFQIEKERTTILIPFGPKFLTSFGRFIERIFRESFMRILGLRRIFICTK